MSSRKRKEHTPQLLQRMPTDLLAYIFTFLSLPCHFLTLRHVCRDFNRISHLPASASPELLCSDTVLDSNQIPLSALQLLHPHNIFTSVHFTHRQLTHTMFPRLITRNIDTLMLLVDCQKRELQNMFLNLCGPSLRTLSLITHNFEDEHSPDLTHFLQQVSVRAPNLECLDVDADDFDDESGFHCHFNMTPMMHLTTLKLNVVMLEQKDMQHLRRAFPKLTSLTLTADDIEFAALGHELIPQLTHLDIQKEVLDEKMILAWVPCNPQIPRIQPSLLQNLIIRYAWLSPCAIMHLLQHLPHLERLELNNARAEPAPRLARTPMPSCSSLKTLVVDLASWYDEHSRNDESSTSSHSLSRCINTLLPLLPALTHLKLYSSSPDILMHPDEQKELLHLIATHGKALHTVTTYIPYDITLLYPLFTLPRLQHLQVVSHMSPFLTLKQHNWLKTQSQSHGAAVSFQLVEEFM